MANRILEKGLTKDEAMKYIKSYVNCFNETVNNDRILDNIDGRMVILSDYGCEYGYDEGGSGEFVKMVCMNNSIEVEGKNLKYQIETSW